MPKSHDAPTVDLAALVLRISAQLLLDCINDYSHLSLAFHDGYAERLEEICLAVRDGHPPGPLLLMEADELRLARYLRRAGLRAGRAAMRT